MQGLGHNSVPADQLRSIVERIERLEEEKAAIADDIKEVYGEAKGTGFDVKILRKVVVRRKMGSETRQEQDLVIEIYEKSLNSLTEMME